MGLRGDEFHPHPAAEFLRLEPDPPRLGHIHHVEGDEHRNAELHHLGDQKEIPFEVARVDHAQDGVGPGNSGGFAPQNFPGNFFIRRAGRKAVHAGQIDQLDRLPVKGVSRAGPFFHGDTGIVGHALAKAREGIKEGAFTGVRISDHRHPALRLVLAQGTIRSSRRRFRRGFGGLNGHSRLPAFHRPSRPGLRRPGSF